MTRSELPLSGLKVLDLTQFVAGPYCTMLLGDLGAEIIKIEIPAKGDAYRVAGPYFVDGESTLFLSLNRNKRSAAIDFRHPDALPLMRQLVRSVDVLVENSRPGALARSGLGYDDVHEANPRLIYCSISGYGQTGPKAHLGGFDLILQGVGGLMSVTGEEPGGPVKVGLPVLDTGAALLASFGITCALLRRERTGQGEHVDVSLLDFSLASLTTVASAFFASGAVPGRRGSASSNFAPYQAFATQDGWITVCGSGSEEMWRRLCAALDRPDLLMDEDFNANSKRLANETALIGILTPIFKSRRSSTWLSLLEKHGVPAGAINSVNDVVDDAQVFDNHLIVSAEEGGTAIPLVGTPLRFRETGALQYSRPPSLGEDTEDILSSLGLSNEDMVVLRSCGVIA